MYWPFTRYAMNATILEWPFSSVVCPVLGGSTITSYISPPVTRKYVTSTTPNTVMGCGMHTHDGLRTLSS